MMKKVAVLGSTGSVGSQTVQVIRENPDKLKAVSLVAFSNGEKLARQAETLGVTCTGLISEDKNCLFKAVENCDVAVVATKGITALQTVLYCLQNGVEVALANKEVLVCAGRLVRETAEKYHGKFLPVDSEHCAITQCLRGGKAEDVDKILLTASGGPFWDYSARQLKRVTAKEALQHPNWNMGQKITVDSATMMNKALEVVEAHWLFDVPTDKIQIVVHRQSVVHSMVQWKSGSVSAQLAYPDMKLPIQLALIGESKCNIPKLDFENLLQLTFQKCDFERFPCARLGYEMENYPELCLTIMNGANDVCVQNFLQGNLPFDKFYDVITRCVENFACIVSGEQLSVENIVKYDAASRKFAQKIVNEVVC